MAEGSAMDGVSKTAVCRSPDALPRWRGHSRHTRAAGPEGDRARARSRSPYAVLLRSHRLYKVRPSLKLSSWSCYIQDPASWQGPIICHLTSSQHRRHYCTCPRSQEYDGGCLHQTVQGLVQRSLQAARDDRDSTAGEVCNIESWKHVQDSTF